LFYHIVWSTKNREPLITPSAEPEIHNLIKTKAIGLGGTVFTVNGIEDHVHVVTAIPPRIAAATFVGQVKGATTAKYNQGRSDEGKIYWQDEYGIFSFDRKRLPNVVAYVENQKQDSLPLWSCSRVRVESATTRTPLEQLHSGRLSKTASRRKSANPCPGTY